MGNWPLLAAVLSFDRRKYSLVRGL